MPVYALEVLAFLCSSVEWFPLRSGILAGAGGGRKELWKNFINLSISFL